MTQPTAASQSATGACQRSAPRAAALRPGRGARPSARAVDRSAVSRGRAGVRDGAGRRCRRRAAGGRRARMSIAPARRRSCCCSDQFARLGDRGIPVYWAGGAVDVPDTWPRSVHAAGERPRVSRRPRRVARPGARRRDDRPRARHQLPRRRRSRGPRLPSRCARPVHDRRRLRHDDSAGHEGDRVHYMALGGRHQQQTVDEQPGIAHYCGTPQGRGPNETGPHGCTVVTVDETRPREAAIRRHRHGPLDRTIARSHRHHARRSNFTTGWSSGWKNCMAKHPGVDLFVRWNIRGTGPLVNRLRPGSLADELLVDLRRKFGERLAARLERVARMRLAAERAGRMVRPGNRARRFPAAGPRLRTARGIAVRPAAVPAGRRPRRIPGSDRATSIRRRARPN